MMNATSKGNRNGLAVAALGVVLLLSGRALAHCDAMDGPVVKDAQVALDAGDVTGVLKWIPQNDEAEVRQAFERTLAVRALSPEARELADMYFLETLVRLHRAGEGAPYTGIKPAGTPVPAPVARADQALEQGEVDDLARRIAAAVEAGIRQRFAATAEAARNKDESVAAGREYVAAYVEFVHYVKAVHDTAMGHGSQHDHDAGHEAPGHGPAAGPASHPCGQAH